MAMSQQNGAKINFSPKARGMTQIRPGGRPGARRGRFAHKIVYTAKIAVFPINGGSGGELEFWCVIQKYSRRYGGPVPAIFMGVV